MIGVNQLSQMFPALPSSPFSLEDAYKTAIKYNGEGVLKLAHARLQVPKTINHIPLEHFNPQK